MQDDLVAKPFQIPELMQKTDHLVGKQKSRHDNVRIEDLEAEELENGI